MRALVLGLLLSSAAVGQTAPPPPAPKEPFSETVFGHRIDDPYRWMEDPARAAEMRAWLTAVSDASVAEIRTLPERARFVRLLDEATQAGVGYSDVQSVGDRLFFQRRDPGARVPKLVVRDGDGPERVLLDPAAGTTETRSIASYAPSPDGRTVAVLVGPGGAELGRFRFIDVATGAERGQVAGSTFGDFELYWLAPDMVSYTRSNPAAGPGADPLLGMQGMVAVLGTGAPVERVALGSDLAGGPRFEPQEFPMITGAPGDPVLLGLSVGARADGKLWVTTPERLRGGAPDWAPVFDYTDQVATVATLGDQLYYVTTKDASNGALWRRSLAGGRPGAATMVMPAGDYALTTVVAVDDGVYVVGTRDGVSHLLWLAAGSTTPREIALPFESELVGLQADADGRSATFGLSGWNRSARYRATGDRIASLDLDSAIWAPAQRFVTRREEAVSRDGTRVPLVILSQPGATGPLPTMLEGYGSYGVLTTSPFYQPLFAGWVGGGGRFAFCGTRGGGERGRAWHEGGRSANKHNAHDDLAACAQRLHELELATPRSTILIGGSAAGLLVPATAMEHPELFGGLVPRVAIVNATRLGNAPNGPNQFAEMGDPREQAGFEALMTQDAYLMAAEARDIPDTLMTIGLNDTRVVPWMTAKFAARARERFAGRREILVRADADQGHGMGSAREAQVAEWADVYAWAWDKASGER